MKKTKIAVIASLIIAILAASLVTIFSKTGTNTQTSEVALQESKQNLSTQSTITYEEVQSGDSDVYYTDGDSQVKIDNFELDAYFIEDNKNVRGVTKYLDENPNLNIVVNASQFVNLTIKDMKIIVSSDGIEPTVTTSTGVDGIINKVENNRIIYFNDFYGGSNSTINVSIKEGLNTSNLSTDLSTENTVTFKGTCVYEDESGNTQSYNFSKVVDFTVDWTGEVEIYSQSIRNYSNDIIGTDDKVILNLAVNTMQFDGDGRRLINKQADYIFEDFAVNGVKPSDVKVTCTNADQSAVYNYDAENDILTYTHILTQGYIPYGYNSIITITYPRSELEAALNNEIVTKQYTIQGKISAIGNKNISYNNNAVYGIMETDYVESTVNIDFRNFTGKIIDFTNRLDDVEKASTRIAYSKSDITESYYNEVWHIKVALDNYYETLEVERNYIYNENKDSAAFFDGTNNVYYSMDDCKYYRGFNIPEDMINLLGGENNAIIEVYSVDDSGNETKITNIQKGTGSSATIVDQVTQSGEYWYKDENGNDISYKNIKFVIKTVSNTNTIGIGDYWITHYMKVDNSKVTSTYDIDTFENFTQVHTSTKISGDSVDTSSVEYIMPATDSADYTDGSIYYYATDEIKLDVINKNFVNYSLTLNTADKYNLQYIENPTLILELPEEFTSVDNIELGRISDTKGIFTVDSQEVLKQNGKMIVKAKLNGELKNETTQIVFKMYLNVPEDEISTSMPDADIRIFIYSDILDGINITPFNGNNGRQVGEEQDIYDIDEDGDTSELQCTATTDVLYLTPSGMSTTTSVRATVDGETLEEICPNVLGLVPNKTNKATIDVNLYLFYLETTISDLKIVGRIPYTDNTYVIDSTQNLGSTFSTTMTSAGITVPDDIKNYTTVYYSETDASITKDTQTTINTSIWKTKDQVTDWTKIKSYLIVIDDAITNDSSMYISTFSYDINLPTDQVFGERSYATHAVEYVSKVGDADEILMQTETNKVGISFVTDTPINVIFTKTEEDETTGIQGAKYEISNFVDGEPIGLDDSGALVYTKSATSTPYLGFSGLYTGIKYKLTETGAPTGYETHDPIVFEIKLDSNNEYYIELDSTNSPTDVIYLNDQACSINSNSVNINGIVIVDERSNADYKVRFWYENPNGGYDEKTDRNYTESAKIGETVSVKDIDKLPRSTETSYEFEKLDPANGSGIVTQDGNLELNVYFKLKEQNYTVKFWYENPNGGYDEKTDRNYTKSAKIGKTVSVTDADKLPRATETIFQFEKVEPGSGVIQEGVNLELNVYFELTEAEYTVRFWYENSNGGYDEKTDRNYTESAKIGKTVSVTEDDRQPKEDSYAYEKVDPGTGTVIEGGNLELNVYFKLITEKYTVRFWYENPNDGYTENTDRKYTDTAKIGETVSVTEDDRQPKDTKYSYEKVNPGTGEIKEGESLELNVYFKLKEEEYTVRFWYENTNGGYTENTDRKYTDTAKIGETVSVTEDDRQPKDTSYTYEKVNPGTGAVKEDGSLELNVYFKLKEENYTVRFWYENPNGGYTENTERKYTDTAKIGTTVSVTNQDKSPRATETIYQFEKTNPGTGEVKEGGSLELNVYFKLKEAKYTVRFWYENSNNGYTENTDRKYTDTAKIGKTVSVTDQDKSPEETEISYIFEKVDPGSGEVNEEGNLELNVYFKYKKANYRVEYYYETKNGGFSQLEDRPASYPREGIVGKTVNVIDADKDPIYNNYEHFVNSENENLLSGEVLADGTLTLKVYFKFKRANYIVRYLYEQDGGGYDTIPGRPDSDPREGIVDDMVYITDDDKDPKHVSYEFNSSKTEKTSGTVLENDQLVLEVYFDFNWDKYRVEYYYQDINDETKYNQKGDRPAKNIDGIVGRTVSVTTEDKESGYTYYEFEETHAENNLEDIVKKGKGTTLKVYFRLKKANYKVRWFYQQDIEGKVFEERADRPVETRKGIIDHTVSVAEDDTKTMLNYYTYDSENPLNVSSGVVSGNGELELKVYFKYKIVEYHVLYYYESREDGKFYQNEDFRPRAERKGIVDFNVSVTGINTDNTKDTDIDPLLNNYKFDSTNPLNNLEGIVSEDNILELKVYFKFKIADYKVEYYYENKDGEYEKRRDITRSGIAYDIAEVTTDDKDPRNEYYTFANEYEGNKLSGTITEAKDGSLVLKVHFRLKKITYNLDLNKQKTNGETLPGTKFSVYLDDATIPMFDLSEVTSDVELQNQVLYMGEYDLWITENSTAGDPYINILDGKYIRIRMNSTTNEEFEVVGANDNENDDFFEVYESDKVTKVTDENILKWIDAIVDPATNTLTVTVKNPIQYNVNITTVDTLNTFVQGNAYSVYRNESLLCTESVTKDIEKNEYLMGAGTYDYYFTQNNFKDRYINILNGRFVKVSVTVAGNGDLAINGTPKLYEGNVGDANAKEVTAEEITKYFNVTVNNDTAISSLELHVIYPVTFNVEVDKMKTDNEPLENTEIKISSPIINDQNYIYNNEQISGVDSITADGTVTGTTDYVIDDGTQARVSYAETYVHANANGYYTYEITEVTPAGGQYVNILEGYKVVLRIKVSGNGDLTLVDENGNPYAENVTKRFTIVATGDKEVTEDLYDYVFIGIDNNTVRAVLNADVINPIRYKMAVHQSLYGTDGRVQVVDMPVRVDGSDLTNRTIEKSPVWATEKVEYKVTQDNPAVDNGLINVLDGYYIGVDVNIPGDGDIKTIASNGDKTTNSYRIYKADGTEVNFNETHIDDFVRVQVTKDNNNVCTVNIYVEVPQKFDVKLLKIDADTKEALNDVEFSMVAQYEGNEIKLKDITKNSDQIFTQYLKTANVDGEDGIIKLNNILIEKAGKYTFVLTETTPDPKPEYIYKDKNGNMIVEFEVTEGDGRYVITNITTNNVDYSEGAIGDNNLVELTVKNERITGVYGVEITKISELLGLPLQGSEFRVRAYKKNADGEDEDVKFYNSVIKTDDTQVVPGTFDINSEDGINNYEIMIENTDKHFLEITEIKAPDTYTKLAEPIVLKVTPKLVGEYDDAKYVIDSIEFISGDNEGLVKLTGYEDEKIKLEVKNNQFDLALRQYVSSINGEDVSRWNTPEIDTTKLVSGEDTTAEYYNNKMPLRIFAGQEVIYTFRVYNEGQIDGYANEIVAYLPEQLEFLENDEFNTSRNWVVDEDNESLKDKNYMTAIKTDYLSKANNEDNLIKAFDHENNEISYIEVQVKCKIKDDEDPRQTVTTLAEITKFEAPTRPEAIDRDSNQALEIPGKDELAEYKYRTENENGYVPGDEDDDDFEKLHIEKFDIATEKFVTSINNEKVEDTEPSFEVDEDGNHINYKETNDDLKIADGNIVEYTIRAYNQGTIDSYADIIEEELPKELLFDKNNPINIEYGWKMLDENRNETDDVTKAKYLTTDYLSKASGENRMTESDLGNPNLIKEFDEETMDTPDYRDVKVILIANLPTEKEGEVVNVARIKSGTDSEGIPLKDEETENDDSNETLDIVYFDLSISKWITETITYENGKETVSPTGYEGNKEDYPLVKVDVKKSKIDEVAIKIKYNIEVRNEGSVPGYAKEITDYIPDGLKLDPADNPNWTLIGNNAVNTELKDKLLAPGETAKVSIVLTWVNLEENVGLKVNVAEITKDYNEQGDTKDIDSVPANKNFEEDDLSDTTKMLISIKTGEEQRYTLIIIAVGAIIGVGIVAIKKYVIK